MVKEEHRAVQTPAPRCWRLFHALWVTLLVAALLAAQSALAVEPADLSASTLGCSDVNGGTLRPGDVLNCTLIVAMAPNTENATVTATIALPATVDIDPAQPPPAYDPSTRVITLAATVLGYTFSGQQRLLGFHVMVAQPLAVGTPIALSADLTAVGDVDSAVVHQTVNSNALSVAPPPADLADSAVSCQDLDGGTLLPGDQFSCTVDAVNAAAHEDAAFVNATLTVTGSIWVSGGISSFASSTRFDTADLGDVGVGTHKSATGTFKVPVSVLGGEILLPFSFISGSSSPSNAAILLSKSATPLVVSPGPATLILSTLVCNDTNGGLLLAGDDVTCTLTVRPAAGHEDVSGASASVTIPVGAEWVSGGDGHDMSSVSFDASSLGDIPAGQAASAGLHMKIGSLAPVGMELQPTGVVNATSVPLGGPVSRQLNGTPLIVGKEAVQPGQEPTLPEQVVTPDVSKPPAAASKSYKLKAKTIRIVMRRGHRRRNHVWNGSRRQFRYVKKYVVRTPKIADKVVKKVTVPKKGKYAPKRGKVKIKGTRLTYTLKKGKKAKDRFHYTVVDTNGKKATGFIVVSREKPKEKK